MHDDDESLQAYLDDRLGGLAQPVCPINLEPILVERIDAENARRVLQAARRWGHFRQALTIGPVAIAASAFLALWLGGAFDRPRPGPLHGPNLTVARSPDRIDPDLGDQRDPVTPAINAFIGPLVPASLLAERAEAAEALAADRARLSALFARPGVREIHLVVDSLDEDGLAPIESTLRTMPRARPSHLRVQVPVDSGTWGDGTEAVVYVIELDEQELGPLRRRLTEALAGPSDPAGDPLPLPPLLDLSASPAEPALLGKLASADRVEGFEDPDRAAGSIVEPRGRGRPQMAFKDDPSLRRPLTGEVTIGPFGATRPRVRAPEFMPPQQPEAPEIEPDADPMPVGPPGVYILRVTTQAGLTSGE